MGGGLWGRLRRLTEAARATYLASEEGRRAVEVSLVSDVIESYFQLLEQDSELDISRRTETGEGQPADCGTATPARRRVLNWTCSQARPIALYRHCTDRRRRTLHCAKEDMLSLLEGNDPVRSRAAGNWRRFQCRPRCRPGFRRRYWSRRPDIRQAEQNLVAANAQIGAARALYFPQLSLTAFAGGQSRYLLDLASAPARVYNVAPTALQAVFHAGQIRNQVRFRKRSSARC